MASKVERAVPAVPNGIGSPLAKVLDKKAKGYLKVFQRSFSSSSLDNNSPTSDEDPTAMTIEFLRARLQAERANLRAEKNRAEALARKVFELEQKLMEEIELRRKTEISSHYQAMMRSDRQSSMNENHGSASPCTSHGTSSTTGDSDESIEEVIEIQAEEDEAELGNLDNCVRYSILRNPRSRNVQNVYHELPPKPNRKPMQSISGKHSISEGEIVAEEIEIEKENDVNNNIKIQGQKVPKADTSPTKDRKSGKASKFLNDQCPKHYTNPVSANGKTSPNDVQCSPCHDPLGCTIPCLWQHQWFEEAQIAANQDYQIDMLYRTLSKARQINPNLFTSRTPSPSCREPMVKSCTTMQRSSSLPLHLIAQNQEVQPYPCAFHSPQHLQNARIQIDNMNAVRDMLRALHVTRPQIENTGSRNQPQSQNQSPARFYQSPNRRYW